MGTENYPLFDKWEKILDWMLDSTEKFPKSVRLTISNRISNMALDTLELIIEAIYTKDRAYILERVNLYIEKLRIIYRICYQRKYISLKQYEFISGELNEAGSMTGGWIRSEKTR